MKKLAAVLAFLLSLGSAQAANQTSLRLFTAYNVASTTYVYPRHATTTSSCQGTAQTTGASTTVTATTSTPFANLAVGDEVAFANCAAPPCTRVVATWASGTSMTVDTAIDMSLASFPGGVACTYAKLTLGAGWQSVNGMSGKRIGWNIAAIAAGSLEFQVECIGVGPYETPNTVWPGAGGTAGLCEGGNGSFTAVGSCAVYIGEPWERCRLGIKVTADAGAQSISASYSGLTIQ